MPVPVTLAAAGRKFSIAVEGNIASGKSTLLDKLRASDLAQVVEEPVAKWQNLLPPTAPKKAPDDNKKEEGEKKGEEGEDGNLMGRMYEDAKRWGFTFQSYVLLTMLEAHATPQTKPLLVLERSVYSARHCFIENLRKAEPPVIDEMEYTVYKRWYDWLMANHRPRLDLIVYLRTEPEVCMARLKKRARTEEAGVPLEYLQSLHTRYEEWLVQGAARHAGVPVLVLDANRDAEKDTETHADFCSAITKAVMETSVAVEEKLTAVGSSTSAAAFETGKYGDKENKQPVKIDGDGASLETPKDKKYPEPVVTNGPETPTSISAPPVLTAGRQLFPSP